MKRIPQLFTVLALAVLSTFFVAGANASTPATANMTVTTAVLDHCIVTANPLSLGTYDPIVTNGTSGADLQGSTTLTVACLTGLHAWIGLSQGSSPNSGSTDTLPYAKCLTGSTSLAISFIKTQG